VLRTLRIYTLGYVGQYRHGHHTHGMLTKTIATTTNNTKTLARRKALWFVPCVGQQKDPTILEFKNYCNFFQQSIEAATAFAR